jgi:hypothetical protein
MPNISDNKALYLQDISIMEYPANTQRIIRSSIDYFCRWIDATVVKDNILTVEYLDSLLSQYHSHLISLKTTQSIVRSKLKYAKLFVLWLQSRLSTHATSPTFPQPYSYTDNNAVFSANKYLYFALISLFICILLYIFYLIVPRLLSAATSRDKYYVINSTKSILIQLNSSSPVLSSNSLESSAFEFRFMREKTNSNPFIIYCPVSYLSMEPDINTISVPLSSCTSTNIDASTELIDFNGYIDVYIDTQFITRRVLI